MNIRPLMIGPREEAMIAEAMRRARAKPVDYRTLAVADHAGVIGDTHELSLAARRPGTEKTVSHGVEIPFGYRAAVTYEEQPDGLAIHISISVTEPGMKPGVLAVNAIAKAFGIGHGEAAGIWMEEFAPGHHAVNLVKIVEWRQKGSA